MKLLLHGRDISENIWEQVSSAIRFLFSDVTCFIAEMYSHTHTYVFPNIECIFSGEKFGLGNLPLLNNF